MEGTDTEHEAKLLPPQRKQAYAEVLPQLRQLFPDARSATDGSKMLVCTMQLPAERPIVLHSESVRVFVRIQPSSVSRQTLAAPGGRQCIDIILGRPGASKDKSPPSARQQRHTPWACSHAASALGLSLSMDNEPTLRRVSDRHPGRMLRKPVGLALFDEDGEHHKLSTSTELWLGTRQIGAVLHVICNVLECTRQCTGNTPCNTPCTALCDARSIPGRAWSRR